MFPITKLFEFDHFGSEIVYGRGCIDRLERKLEERGFDRALVVCGSNVGRNEAVMEPVKEGLDDKLAAVFDGTTPGSPSKQCTKVSR